MSDSAVPKPTSRRRWWLTAAGIVVLVVVAFAINRTTAQHESASPLRASLIAKANLPDCPTTTGTGKVANGLPALTFPCLANGPKVELAKLRGPLVVNIWAGTCIECRVEAPQLAAFARAAGSRVAVLGVVDGAYLSESWDDALDASRGLALGYPSVWDANGKLVQATRSIGIPVSLFIKADGTVAGRKVGVLGPGELQQLVKRYLAIEVSVP
jgi:thiol-disulfide isomerase/thioredoxin